MLPAVSYTKCVGCGSKLSHHPRQRNPKKWCSESCRVRSYYSSKPELAAEQKRKSAERSRAVYVPVEHDLACVVCASPFKGRMNKLYCSRSCSNKAYGARRQADGRAADYTARRRALEKGAKVSRGRRLEVLERDAWVCQLCGHPTRREAVYPDWDFAVIDHALPLSLGGEHSLGNWQTAHAFCNGLKADLDPTYFHLLYPDLAEVIGERLTLTTHSR